MKITIPQEGSYILNKLMSNGFEAFIVGGSVRDSLLNKTPKDFDITTNAVPSEVMSIFDHTIPTGLIHGTVTVIINAEHFEITTYRIDGEYGDNRHPSKVTFTSSLEQDLSRRDFTINAMAYGVNNVLQDPFHGLIDLKKQWIRTVGAADLRFNEDALRMLRAVRFSCQLNFEIEVETLESIITNSHLLKNISMERLRDELCKILLCPVPSKGIRLLQSTKLLQYILPEIIPCIGFDQQHPYHDKDVFDHTLSVLDNTPSKLTLRLAALLHDISKPDCFTLDEKGIGHFYTHEIKGAKAAKNILKALRFDNNTINTVSLLIKEHMTKNTPLKSSSIKRYINRVGIENLEDLFYLQVADIKGLKPTDDFNVVFEINKMVTKVLQENEPLKAKDLAIDGKDLIKLGYAPGKELGELLNFLLEQVIDNPKLNTREELLMLTKSKVL
jgi:tRNA nucleotidyltransferase (CCA-adding enzyme)